MLNYPIRIKSPEENELIAADFYIQALHEAIKEAGLTVHDYRSEIKIGVANTDLPPVSATKAELTESLVKASIEINRLNYELRLKQEELALAQQNIVIK